MSGPVAQTMIGTGAPGGREGGQGMVEAVMGIPAFLLLAAFLLQFALLGMARLHLQYAAFCATRTGALEGGDGDRMTAAARTVLLSFPGGRWAALGCRTEVLPIRRKAFPENDSLLSVRVSWDYPLLIPMAGAALGRPPASSSGGYPFFPLSAVWTTLREPALPGEAKNAGKGGDR